MITKKFIKLSWMLLEAKVKYYLYPQVANISDDEYDKLEKEYLTLCKQLNRPNTIQSMVGVDKKRLSVRLVIEKLDKMLKGDYTKNS